MWQNWVIFIHYGADSTLIFDNMKYIDIAFIVISKFSMLFFGSMNSVAVSMHYVPTVQYELWFWLQSFSESLSNAVCGAVAPSVTTACRDAYSKFVLPGFNTLTNRILQQFNELFHKGTTECERSSYWDFFSVITDWARRVLNIIVSAVVAETSFALSQIAQEGF